VRVLAWIGALALVVGASLLLGRELAIREYQTAQWRAEAAATALRDSLRLARANVRVDSVRVTETVTRWRVVRDSLVDTLRTTDTVRVLVRAADAAVTTCTDALGRCQAALALATRSASADSVALVQLRAQLAIAEGRATRAESRATRHRAEGAAAALLGVGLLHRSGAWPR
jgi:translation initiation factor 2B subunit (eIF-2B alpha/beta/delta family)